MAPWRVEPRHMSGDDESPEAQVEDPRVEYLSTVLFDDLSQSWTQIVSDAMTCAVHGYSLFEIVLKRRRPPTSYYDDGLLGLESLAFLPQSTLHDFYFDPKGKWQSVRQQIDGHHADIHRNKLLLMQYFPSSDPTSRSPMLAAWGAMIAIQAIERVQFRGIANDSTGTPVAKAPNEWFNENVANATENAAALESIKSMLKDFTDGTSNSLLTSADITVELLKSPGSRMFSADSALKRYDFMAMLPFMAAHLLLGGSSVGSHALAQELQRLLDEDIQALFDGFADAVNRQIFPNLLLLNGMDPANAPILTARNPDEQEASGEVVDEEDDQPAEGGPVEDEDEDDEE